MPGRRIVKADYLRWAQNENGPDVGAVGVASSIFSPGRIRPILPGQAGMRLLESVTHADGKGLKPGIDVAIIYRRRKSALVMRLATQVDMGILEAQAESVCECIINPHTRGPAIMAF